MSETSRTLIEAALESTANDRTRLFAALTQLAAADAAFGFSFDPEIGQTILRCIDEAQLDAKVERLRGDFGLSFEVGAPQVAYRERLTCVVDVDCTHKKQLGGAGQFARVRLRFEPLVEGSGEVFVNGDSGVSVPLKFIPGIKRGIDAARQNGVLAGFPLIEFMATLVGGANHEVDSSDLSFEIATRAALRELLRQDAVELVEPVMDVTVATPTAYFKAVYADLVARGSSLESLRPDEQKPIAAIVPLARMLRFRQALAALTEGHGTYTMTFSHYAPVRSGEGGPTFPLSAAMRA